MEEPPATTANSSLSDSAGSIAHQIATVNYAYLAASGSDVRTFTKAIHSVLGNKAPPLNSPVYPRLFAIFDANHDGVVDMAELLTGIISLTTGGLKEKATLVFKYIDKDNDGYISQQECEAGCFNVFTTSLKYAENEEAKKALAEAGFIEQQGEGVSLRDSQKSRRVKYGEIVAKIRETVTHIFESDENRDGKLSMDEWVRHVRDNPALKLVVDFYTL